MAVSRPLVVRLAHGSITKAETTAIVVSHFEDLVPTGAGAAVAAADHVIRGTISRFAENRILRGQLGEFVPIPALTADLPAQLVIVMGLGPYDVFNKKMSDKKFGKPELMQAVARSLVAGLLQINVTSFATILFGAGGGGLDPAEASYDFLTSLGEALEALDPERRIHELTIAEIDARKLAAIRKGCERAGADLADRFSLDLREVTIPRADIAAPTLKPVVYLTVRRDQDRLKYSILADHPLEVMVAHPVSDRAVDELSDALLQYGDRKALRQLQEKGTDLDAYLKRMGEALRAELIPEAIMDDIRKLEADVNLILSLDKELAYIPWELIFDDQVGKFLCQRPLGRQVREKSSSVRREPRDAKDTRIDMLIVANPAGNLPVAEAEGRRLHGLIAESLSQVNPTLWDRAEVPSGMSASTDIIRRLNTYQYEIVHYAGHAAFNETDSTKSAWLTDPSGKDLVEAFRFQNIPRPPVLVFDNACESARFERSSKRSTEVTYGLAEGFLKSRVSIYVGTTWVVDDRAAAVFAFNTYQGLASGWDIGEAMVHARDAVRAQFGLGEPTWASYVLYGSPSFRL